MSGVGHLIGIDVGTSSAKIVVIQPSGDVVESRTISYPMATPQPGWAEQDPESWWEAVRSGLSGIDPREIDAIGVSGQMHGSVFLDNAGSVIRPALLWCDQRTERQVSQVTEVLTDSVIRQTTGNPMLAGFQLPKVLWLQQNEPENYARLAKVLLPKDFIAYRLTGELSTDVSDASGVGLLNLRTRTWDDDLLVQLAIEASLFPPVYESDAIVGHARGLGDDWKDVPVVAGAGDQAAAAISTGAVSPGSISISLGTSGVAFASTVKPVFRDQGLLHSFCHANRAWHVMAVMLACGGSLSWAKNILMPADSWESVEFLASQSSTGADGVTFLPYLSGERFPVVESRPMGAWVGLALASGSGDLLRAVYEGVACGVADLVDGVCGNLIEAERIIVTGGGSSSQLLMSILANLLGRDLERPLEEGGPALGAAMLAGVGMGIWRDLAEAVDAIGRAEVVATPSGTDYSEVQGRYRSLYPVLSSWPRVSN